MFILYKSLDGTGKSAAVNPAYFVFIKDGLAGSQCHRHILMLYIMIRIDILKELKRRVTGCPDCF